MGTIALPISGLVNVQVSVAAAASQAQNTTSLLLLTNNQVIDLQNRLLKFSSLAEVGEAFGSNGIEYDASTLWFAQRPQPTDILIGRWVKTAASGVLVGATLTSDQQAISHWTPITSGKLNIAVNNFAPVLVEDLDFSEQTNLNGVAETINEAMTTAGVQARCAWSGSNFQFTSVTTGAVSSVNVLPITLPPEEPPEETARATGNGKNGKKVKASPRDDAPEVAAEGEPDPDDISGNLGVVGTGSFAVQGADPETALDSVNLFDLNFGYQWYAMVIPEATDEDHIEVAVAIQAMTTKHFYGITTADARTLDQTSRADIAFLLSQKALTHAAVQYSSTSPYAVVSMLARILTTDYRQNTSVITLMYKQQPGVTAEFLNRTQLASLLSKNANVFVAYQGGALIIQPGTTTATNQFIDTIIGLDNLAIEIQLNIFNLLYTTTTKVPQTDAGMNQIISAAEQILLNYVEDGLLAPGVWTDYGFGKLQSGDFVEKGYYIYCPPLSQQSAADRAKRMAGPMKIAVKLAGAIHTVDASIDVNP
jgi:Protein of unknown function (DUF3383)